MRITENNINGNRSVLMVVLYVGSELVSKFYMKLDILVKR